MNWPERLANWFFGLNVLSWAAIGGWELASTHDPPAPRIAAIAINLVVGVLFLIRAPLSKSCGAKEILLSVPSLVFSGLLFRVAVERGEWNLIPTLLLGAGVLVAIAAMLNLGRSFAVLPASRPLVRNGLYRFVRHPMYLGEFTMGVACLVAAPGWQSGAALTALLPFVAIRILIEERFLSACDTYQGYASAVRYRLFPGIW